MTCRVALLVAFIDGSWVWIGKDAPNFRNAETKLDSQSFDRADRQLTCRLMVDGYLTRAAARSTLGQNAFVDKICLPERIIVASFCFFCLRRLSTRGWIALRRQYANEKRSSLTCWMQRKSRERAHLFLLVMLFDDNCPWMNQSTHRHPNSNSAGLVY